MRCEPTSPETSLLRARLVATRLARIPAKGDELDLDGWRLHVLDVEHHRADRVRILEPARVPVQAGEESR